MQESQSTSSNPANTDVSRTLRHNEVAQCARDLWIQSGQPADCDQAIWFEAERQMLSATQQNSVLTATPQETDIAQPARVSDYSPIQPGAPWIPAQP